MVTQQNKFLTFMLGNEAYGIPILKVKEIIGMMAITQVPRRPEFIKGVINLRGKIIPVMDLRLKFGIESKEYDNRTCIIVVEIAAQGGSRLSGLVVDTVSDVMDIPAEKIEKPSTGGVEVDEDCLIGLGKVKDKVILLLDTDKVLSEKEKETLVITDTEEVAI